MVKSFMQDKGDAFIEEEEEEEEMTTHATNVTSMQNNGSVNKTIINILSVFRVCWPRISLRVTAGFVECWNVDNVCWNRS